MKPSRMKPNKPTLVTRHAVQAAELLAGAIYRPLALPLTTPQGLNVWRARAAMHACSTS